MSWFNDPLFGGSEKDRKRQRISQNRARGKAAEDLVETELLIEGWEVERVHEGADFHAKRGNFLTGEVEEKKVEVKSGNAKLSEKQKAEKRRSDNYEVRRRDPWFGF